jgi:spermidine/putrescine transport system permease protein
MAAHPASTSEQPERRAARGRLRVDGFKLFWGAPLIVWQAAFFLAALVFLVLMSFWVVENFLLTRVYTVSNWTELLTSGLFHQVYVRTFVYAAVAAVAATVLAFPFAYALAFRVSPGARRLALMLLITPFFTNYVLRSYSWQVILADNGILNNALAELGIGSIRLLGTPFATGIGYLTYFFPLVTILLLLSLVNVDRDLVEAANNLGAGRLRSIFTVVIPSAKIGIVFAIGFAFILAFGDFIAPSLLGSQNAVTLSILINSRIKSGADFPEAATVALVMVITLLVVVFAIFRIAFPPRKETRAPQQEELPL